MRIGLIHLGRTAAGPLLLEQLTAALHLEGHSTIVAYSSDAEIAHDLERLPDRAFGIRTFRSPVGAVTGMFRLPRITRTILDEFDRFGVEAVVIPMEQIWQALIAPRLARTYRLVLFVHDATMHDGEFSLVGNWLRQRERKASSRAIVLSSHVAQGLLESGLFARQEITRTRHPAFASPVDHLPRSLPTSRTLRVGFFGRMARYKGLELGLAAIARVRSLGQRVEFHVIGANVPQDIENLDHADNIVDDRWIPQDEVEQTLAILDVLLLPYIEASQSGVLAYAMTLGIPVVVTPVGGLSEQALESGCAVIATAVTPDAVADALIDVLTDPAEYSRLSKAGIANARETFSWQQTATDLVGAIRSLT